MFDVGIRRETKNRWERRTPLTPLHVRELIRDLGRSVVVQPSARRIFADEAYREAGAVVSDDLSAAGVILGVKEIPGSDLVPNRPHLFFSHVIKGQRRNMPLLRQLLVRRCTLIDYEPIADAGGRRLMFFGLHAGYAGMIDALWALGQSMTARGIDTAFAEVLPAHRYASLQAASAALAEPVAGRIRTRGIGPDLHPMVVGFTGGGNVSQGAQHILANLPVVDVRPDELPGLAGRVDLSRRAVYRVVFRRDDRANLEAALPFLTILVNGVYWTPGDQRLVTRAGLTRLWGGPTRPKLQVIADISADVGGSIEATVRHTTPDDPVFVYDAKSDSALPGLIGDGVLVLAVDNLPAELPREASEHFGDSLFPFLAGLIDTNFSAPFDALPLVDPLRRGTVTHQGVLTPSYAYLERSLLEAGA